MIKIILQIFPYVSSIISGVLFFIIGFNQQIEDLKAVYLAISGTLLGIPIVFLFFDVAKSISEQKLSKNVFNYYKMQIDTDLLTLTKRIARLIYSYDNLTTFKKDINQIFQINKDDLLHELKVNRRIVFQMLMDLKGLEDQYRKKLNFGLSIRYLDKDALNILIDIGKSFRSLITFIERTEGLIQIHKDKSEFIAKRGSELNNNNPEYSFLLLKTLKDKKFVVIDSGEFTLDKADDLLNYCDINPQLLPAFADKAFNLIENIKKWLKITNYEFLVDTRQFKTAIKK